MSNPAACPAVKILLVDDNPGDIRLTREALKEGNIHHHLRIAMSGDEALTMLRHSRSDERAPLPDMILLDLNLPGKSGLEVLAEIKADDVLKKIPVVMLTTSGDAQDIQTAYDCHANCYIVKPVELDKFIQVIKSLENFWVGVVTLPVK